MSPSPVGPVENKVLPVNFQMVTQSVHPVKHSPKTLQNILTSPVGERTARQRYAQILPKPSATTAITLRSPSTMIIANNPVKTMMTTCHVSPVSLVTAISLAPHSSNASTALTDTTLRPSSAGISTSTVPVDITSSQSMRSASAVPVLFPVARPEQAANASTIDVEMEIETIHKNSQMQSLSGLILTQGVKANGNGIGGAMQRASSVPIPQTKGFLGLEETSNECNGKVSSSTNTVAATESNNISAMNKSNLHLTHCTQSNSAVSLFNTSRTLSFGENSSITAAKKVFLSTKSFRKRSGLSPDLSPVKRVFIPQQAAGGAAGLGYGITYTDCDVSRPGLARPESAPATREAEMKMNLSAPVHSSFRDSDFCLLPKTQSAMQTETGSTFMDSVGHTLMQQQPNMQVIPNSAGLQKYSGVTDVRSSNLSLEAAGQQSYCTQSNPATEPLEFLNQASSSSQLPTHTDMDYFPFDDDVTQDSIVEELVQMEEQMNLNNLHKFGNYASLQGQQALMANNIMSPSQPMTAFYHSANSSSSNLIQTPTPTPTPTSEIMGGSQGLTGESPCSRIASTTPVDSALGSSRHTPIGTPHSNCSSTVPPSPVECRNPFAFTPINSSITGFHDSSTVSSSPVKPMQRPTATHPDKTRLEWMNNSYNSSSGTLNKSNSGMGILPGYQGLREDHFQKPHAFAVPHARHHDSSFGRLTPISPVQQQQAASMANTSKQEGFAVPAPLDNKTSNMPTTSFRCRSVSPAVHQKNFCGSTGSIGLPNVPRSVVSPFNSPVTPEMLNIFANSQTDLGVSNMAQRSRSVPLNIMMQTEVLPPTGQECPGKNIAGVLLRKLDGDYNETVRGLGINNLPSSYTARINLNHILESDTKLSCADSHLSTFDSTNTCKLQGQNYLTGNAINEQMILSAGSSQMQSASGEHQQAHPMLFPTLDPLCEIRMTSELSSGINDLNALDTNLLFDPDQQQGQYQTAGPEELVNDSLFQQITSETTHSSGLDWLESKDHPTVGLMG